MALITGQGSGSGKISGVTVSGTAASGQVPVASSASAGSWAYPPGFEIGYDQITSNVNVVSTSSAAPTALITCAAHTFDGGAVIVEAYSPRIGLDMNNANDIMAFQLTEGGTSLGVLGVIKSPQTANQQLLFYYARWRFTPTAASHTYVLAAHVTSTAGAPFFGAGAAGSLTDVPAFVRFTKV